MVTTRRAEGFSPPTTKGANPPASVQLDAVIICHNVVLGGWGGYTGAANGGGGAARMRSPVC